MTILCWPCGNVYQTFKSNQHVMEIPSEQIPPGALLLDSETCELECAPGWARAPKVNITPAWWTPTSFHFTSASSFPIPMLLPDLGDNRMR